MASVRAMLSLCSIAIFVLVINKIIVYSHGLRFRMIHSNPLNFSSLQNNISHEKRLEMLASQSSITTNYNSKISPSTILADVHVQHYTYMVRIGIGTFKTEPPYKEYYLIMVTGSDNTWLQCEGCTTCFKPTPSPFPKDMSSSFRPILSNNKNKPYYYYSDEASSHGILANETFYLKTGEGLIEKIRDIQFGCGFSNKINIRRGKNNRIIGAIGLGWGPKSFFQQLGPKTKGKFSYCLPVKISGNTPSTYLRFGDDIPQRKKPKSTPLYKGEIKSCYYVKMQDISINKVRLNISQRVFALRNNDTKPKYIFDTGSTYSYIMTPVFQILKLELEKYFLRFKGLSKINKDHSGFKLCYYRSKAEGFKNLPSITYHLQGSGADFVLKAEAAFFVDTSLFREYFCLAMIPKDFEYTIGSYQQTNHRIIYDTKNEQLIFHPEDCLKNP